MKTSVSSVEDVLAALPAVQKAVEAEIAARIVAGEFVAGVEGDRIVASEPVARDLAAERRALLKAHETRTDGRARAERKSVA